MYSMNYLGKFFANFKEFYNEINGATLTGAIDVVVVEQEDGSFTCSPFHVRFGKLGVLRSRFKVVDLELNGEPLNIHMKLGEAGEAFFVEEVPEDEIESSVHLATSPIPDSGFSIYQEEALPRRNSADYPLDKYQNQTSDYTHRRYTADGQTTTKTDISTQKRDYNIAKKLDVNSQSSSHETEQIFTMDDLDDNAASKDGDPLHSATAKTFKAEELDDKNSHAKDVIRKISINNDFRPINLNPSEEIKLNIEDSKLEDPLKQSNNKKRKKTKKSGSKKKNSQRKSSSSSNGYSSQSDPTDIIESEPSIEKLIADQLSNEDISSISNLTNVKHLSDVHFYSDTDIVSQQDRREEDRNISPVQSDSELEMARGSGVDTESPQRQSWKWGELPQTAPTTSSSSLHHKHMSAADSVSSDDDQPRSQEKNKSESGAAGGTSMLSGMLKFMKQSRSTANNTEGVYLADITGGSIDPEVAALYFPPHQDNSTTNVQENLNEDATNNLTTEEDYESGNGPSLPQSPSSVEGMMCKGLQDSDGDDFKIFCKGYVGLSLCGTACLDQPLTALNEAFEQNAVQFETLCKDPTLVANPKLVVRIGNKFMPWATAAPILLSLIVYHRPLPKSALNTLPNAVPDIKEHNLTDDNKNQQRTSGYSWWSWRRSAEKQIPSSSDNLEKPATDSVDGIADMKNKPELETNINTEVLDSEANKYLENDLSQEDCVAVSTQTSFPSLSGVGAGGYSGSQSSEDSDEAGTLDNSSATLTASQSHPHSSKHSDRFRKTLRLSSEQIASLNLREGMNEMVFSVTTAYQGTSRCKCHVFRWRYDDKIVISDIDGTITKSDVLGHIFPLVGKDWAQSGVAQLFTKIKNNGYKILYLSARAIGQAKVTREYLRSIKQGDLSLPDGPLLLNPTSLLRAFHREVIEKKPEEFKIQCLSDIMALFPEGLKPFYAGYGNRVNDVCAYQAVGIPIVRIFTINYKGELKHELTQTFQSSYSNMCNLVDHLFPPVKGEVCEDFSQFNYWREPVLQLPEISPTTSLHSMLPSIPENPGDT